METRETAMAGGFGRRQRVVITVVALAAVALAFYVFSIVWQLR
jgi:hypothetical protein